MARSVYLSLIESHLRYGISFWGTCSNYLFQSVFVMQKRAIRFMCGAKYRDSCRPLFIKHKILTLACLFILETVCLIKKKVENRSSVYPLRNTHTVSLPIPTSTLTKNSLFYNGRKLFNSLPVNLREMNDLRKFKREVRQFLVAKAYYTIEEFYGDLN